MIEFIIMIGVNYGEVLTGGVVVMHKLAYEIANRGHKVYIFTKPEYPHPNIVVNEFSQLENLISECDPNKTVIVPFFEWKNTTNIKNVARWATYHILEEQMTNVDEWDEIFNFGGFYIPTKKNVKNLTLFEYHKQIFYNYGQKREKILSHPTEE